MSRNEAAERLRRWFIDDLGDAGMATDLEEALATERRLTVEWVRERLDAFPFDQGDHEYGWKDTVRSILAALATADVDEEAGDG